MTSFLFFGQESLARLFFPDIIFTWLSYSKQRNKNTDSTELVNKMNKSTNKNALEMKNLKWVRWKDPHVTIL